MGVPGWGSQNLMPPSDQEFALGEWGPGRYAWMLENVIPFREEIVCRGSRGLWTPGEHIQDQVQTQIINHYADFPDKVPTIDKYMLGNEGSKFIYCHLCHGPVLVRRQWEVQFNIAQCQNCGAPNRVLA